MKDRTTLEYVYDLVKEHGFTITVNEPDRVYGASIMLAEEDADRFIDLYFRHLQLPPKERVKVSPKYMLVDAGKRLSWQYHKLRSEHWTVVRGPVGIALSGTDDVVPPDTYLEGEFVSIPQGTRHRLVGLATAGVIAEVWTHEDPGNPSSEADIIRLQDDYNRPREGDYDRHIVDNP